MNVLRVIDSHVHFWDPAVLSYPWLRVRPELHRAFLPGDFDALMQRQVDAVLFVEANCAPATAATSEAELDFLGTVAAGNPSILGSVAFVDLQDSLTSWEALQRLKRRRSVVSVRQNIQEQPAGFCLTRAFIGGVQQAGAVGFTFDLCATPDQLGDVIELVRRCPTTRFVLDHCGKPAIRDNAFAPWANSIRGLATLPNVACKISGLFTESRPEQRTAAVLRPYVQHVRECFGPTRVLYGSDWPVVSIAGGEVLWRTTIAEITNEWSFEDRQLLFADNVTRHYPLLRHAIS